MLQAWVVFAFKLPQVIKEYITVILPFVLTDFVYYFFYLHEYYALSTFHLAS